VVVPGKVSKNLPVVDMVESGVVVADKGCSEGFGDDDQRGEVGCDVDEKAADVGYFIFVVVVQ
jgi:hypothetical protein